MFDNAFAAMLGYYVAVEGFRDGVACVCWGRAYSEMVWSECKLLIVGTLLKFSCGYPYDCC